MSGYTKKKYTKKINKFKHILSQRGISISDEPTQNLVICNGGIANGFSENAAITHFKAIGCNIERVHFDRKETVSFFECSTIEEAIKAVESELILPDGTRALKTWIEKMPDAKRETFFDLPPGLILLNDFLTEQEESLILNSLDLKISSGLKHRLVKHFGYEFDYTRNRANENPIEPIPDQWDFLWPRLIDQTGIEFHPKQCTVNIYEPGQGIPAHVDTHSAFTDIIASLSLSSDVVMEFVKNERKVCVLLQRRSLCLMTGESRYNWSHAIRERKSDLVPGKGNALCLKPRERRISLTFRIPKWDDQTCTCNNSVLCDLKKEIDEPAKVEENCVHKVYDEIAEHFSETRHKPWPNVSKFLLSFPEGSLILDVGCGNGKYLSANSNYFLLGCDRSFELLKLCGTRGFQVFRCDCLALPIRDNFFDGCICIAVLHHLSQMERRLQALRELIRVLKPLAKVLIYVWAKNQTENEEKSSYLKQKESKGEEYSIPKESFNLPVHKNRTNFQHSDLLVPWKEKKGMNTYFRYYHVFEEDELKNLCEKIDNVKIIDSYYDNGNHCVILQKI